MCNVCVASDSWLDSGGCWSRIPAHLNVPFWSDSKILITAKYQNGNIAKEECATSTKTVEGRYIVSSIDSKFYKRTMYSITGFDEKASAIRVWGLFGEMVTEGTIVVDREKKVIAMSSAYGEGFTEISVGTCSIGCSRPTTTSSAREAMTV